MALTFTLAVSAESGATRANAPELTAEEFEELQVAIRVESILARNGMQVAQDLSGDQPNEVQAGQHLLEAADAILAEYEKTTPPAAWQRMHDGLHAFSWRGLAKDMVGVVHTVATNIPAQGAAISMIDHFVVLPWLIFSGQHAVAVLAALPIWGPGYIAARYALPNFLLRQELIRIYGGRANYRLAKEGERALLTHFKLKNTAELLLRNSDQAYVISPSPGRLRGMWQWLGLGSDHLDYGNLLELLKSVGFDPKLLAAMNAEHRLPDHYKAAMLLQVVAVRADAKVRLAVGQRFAKFLVETPPQGEPLAGVTSWARTLVRARSLEEIERAMRATPEKLPAKVVARIWEEALLPAIGKHIPGMPVNDMAGLQRRFAVLRAQTEVATGANANWSAAWQARFQGFLSENLSPIPAHCAKQAGKLVK